MTVGGVDVSESESESEFRRRSHSCLIGAADCVGLHPYNLFSCYDIVLWCDNCNIFCFHIKGRDRNRSEMTCYYCGQNNLKKVPKRRICEYCRTKGVLVDD
jgi:hypothetical protein